MADESRQIVIVAAACAPIGRFESTFSSFSAIKLRAIAIRDAVHRIALDPP
jgi:acetyl-CoA acetyltransferase